MIRGETVSVRARTGSVADEFNNEVPTYAAPVDVPGVVVAPGTTTGETRQHPDGVSVALTLHFPKSYDGDLRGALVTVRGHEYRVVGDPEGYTKANVRGPWWLPVEVARADG